jgi:hypothetical protein
MTTSPELTAAGRAIAGVRERFSIYDTAHGCDVVDRLTDAEPFHGTRDQCQAWIDCEMARAAFESVLPVSNRVVEAAYLPIYGITSDKFGSELREEVGRIVTAAIHAITGRDGT